MGIWGAAMGCCFVMAIVFIAVGGYFVGNCASKSIDCSDDTDCQALCVAEGFNSDCTGGSCFEDYNYNSDDDCANALVAAFALIGRNLPQSSASKYCQFGDACQCGYTTGG